MSIETLYYRREKRCFYWKPPIFCRCANNYYRYLL